MKLRFPFWITAVVPAALAGHAAAYGITGRALIDSRHLWLPGALETSLFIVVAVGFSLLAGTLLRKPFGTYATFSTSLLGLWARLASAQTLLFALLERAEGSHAIFTGCLVQCAVALLAAFLLVLFARVVRACAGHAGEASAYLERLCAGALRIPARACALVPPLAVCTGTHRFQRPPPSF